MGIELLLSQRNATNISFGKTIDGIRLNKRVSSGTYCQFNCNCDCKCTTDNCACECACTRD